MSLKATRTPCERRGDITSQLEVFCGSSFGRGASPASRVGCAIPLLLFCWSGRRLERGKLLIFWFCCSKSHFSWKWMGVWLRQAPFLKATYLSGDHFFGKPMRILSDEKYNTKIPTVMQGACCSPEAVSAPRSPHQLQPTFLLFSVCFQIVFYKTKIIIRAFSLFILLGWVTSVYFSFPCSSLLPSIWGQALWGEFWTGRMWHCFSRPHLRLQMVGKIQPTSNFLWSSFIIIIVITIRMNITFINTVVTLYCTSGFFSPTEILCLFLRRTCGLT